MMKIYVDENQKPKCCADCEFCGYSFSPDIYNCNALGGTKIYYTSELFEKCPLLLLRKNETERYREALLFVFGDNNISPCNYCENFESCKRYGCEFYESGNTCTVDGLTVNVKWNCTDFTWGTCRKLADTPCNGCLPNYTNFEPRVAET
jgi:hypothetical protein